MNFKQLFSGIALLTTGSFAQASVIDFIDMTENGTTGMGESAWTNLGLTIDGINISIFGGASNDDDAQQYAYLDWGNAGLGVCKDIKASAIADVANPSSGSNLCNPSSDDNVTIGEYLEFVFDQDVTIENFWFNNNHDGGFDVTDMVTIAGNSYSVNTGYAGGPNGIGAFFVAANTAIRVAYNNEEFYMSGMQISATNVPEPGTLAILSLGLLGLGLIRRKS